jgi:hypothetical protein
MRVLVAASMWPTQRHPWAWCFVKEQLADVKVTGAEVEVMVVDG